MNEKNEQPLGKGADSMSFMWWAQNYDISRTVPIAELVHNKKVLFAEASAEADWFLCTVSRDPRLHAFDRASTVHARLSVLARALPLVDGWRCGVGERNDFVLLRLRRHRDHQNRLVLQEILSIWRIRTIQVMRLDTVEALANAFELLTKCEVKTGVSLVWGWTSAA
jgi:hypothetical protein